MLTEHFVASIRAPDKAVGASGSKDVGVFIHELQPLTGQRQAFKKSATEPNCLAASESHVFAAQAEKAVVHVYNRAKGNHEATIPFNEKITCIALAASNSVLILGTEGGRIILWELLTGRQTSTNQSHIQAVSALAVDATSNSLVSGSIDSNVHAWSLLALLAFSEAPNTLVDPRSPTHSHSNHRGPVTCLSIGHSHSQLDFAVTGSQDMSVVIWDYNNGNILRTILLQAIPRALALDVSDRAFYSAYDDGTIQMIDLYNQRSAVSALHDEDLAQIPVQPHEKHIWQAQGQELGAGICLSLSWDGTRLLSGHKSGKIVSWDTRKGTFVTVVETLAGPVSNLLPLPVQGFAQTPSSACKHVDVSRPTMGTFASAGIVPQNYDFHTQFATQLSARHFSALEISDRKGSFQAALSHPFFPASLLEEGINQLAERPTTNSKVGPSDVDVEDRHDEGHDKAQKELADLKAHNEHLQQQCARLQSLQNASFGQIREKSRVISRLVKEQHHLADIAKAEYGWEIRDINMDWADYQQRSRNASGGVSGKTKQSSDDFDNGDSEEGESGEEDDEESEEDVLQMDVG